MNLDFDIGRLAAAMQRSRLVLRRPRQERVDMVRQFVGRHWSDEGAATTIPVNFISQYVQVVGRKLIANNPRALISTWKQKAKATVHAMADWVNEEIQRINLANTLGRVVVDALFSVGICKVSLATPADSALGGWSPKAGQPMATRVDLDDFVFDIHARDFSEVGYIGHRYRTPLRVIRESKIYSKQRKELSAESDRLYNMEGDERIGVLGRTTLGGDQEEFEDFVDLWEVYLPRHKVVLTLRDDNLTGAASGEDKNYGKALRIQKWIGHPMGPYLILGMLHVPGNPMPKAPIQDLYDLHIAANSNMRRLIRQQDRQKTITFVQGGAAEDGARIMEGSDGDILRVDNPEKIKEVAMGGPNQQNFMLFQQLDSLFNKFAGNLDIMGGISPEAKTLGQTNLLNTNSSATISEMQDKTTTFVADVVKRLCWYWHHDPISIQRTQYSIPGTKLSIPRRIFPNNPAVHGNRPGRLVRDHAFEDMQIEVDPYSMQHQTPQTRLQELNQVIQQIYLPMAQQAQQQGISLDLQAYFEKIAGYLDDPDLPDILTVGEPPQEDTGAGGGAQGPTKPPETTRNYVRRSMGKQGPEAQMAQMKQPGANGKPVEPAGAQ